MGVPTWLTAKDIILRTNYYVEITRSYVIALRGFNKISINVSLLVPVFNEIFALLNKTNGSVKHDKKIQIHSIHYVFINE